MARKTGSHSDITGPKVKDAALRLFARHGYAAVSMRQIAGEVGLQAGALYNYTPDKQSLLMDLMREHLLELLATLRALPSGKNAREALDNFTLHHIRFHMSRRDEVFLAYNELRNLTELNFAEIEKLRRQYETELENILKSGVESQEFQIIDTKVTAMALIALLTGMANWYRPDGRLPVGQLEEVYVDLVRKTVGGQ